MGNNLNNNYNSKKFENKVKKTSNINEINYSKNKLNKSNMSIEQHKLEINDLKNQLNKDNIIIEQQKLEINDLKNVLIKANIIIEQQKLEINNLQNQLNSYNNINNTINNYKNIINQKDIEINNLRLQLNNINNFNNMPNNNINIDEIKTVNFLSSDKKIYYAVPCIGSNTFAEIEEKLYQKYPQYRETNNNFIANETEILRFKTISENNIGYGLPVTLIVPAKK